MGVRHVARRSSSCPRGLLGVALAALAAAAGCPASQVPDGGLEETGGPDERAGAGAASTPKVDDPLAITYDPATFNTETKLLDKLRSSPFAYFRYLAAPFARTVCEGYSARVAGMPTVSLHGDLHLEQYAVADDGFGIVDFDDATKGPPMLDWLRFTTSVWLASMNDEKSARAAIARFVDGYEKGLQDPNAVMDAPEPRAAARIRKGFNTTPTEWLDQVTALIKPLDEMGQQKMSQARERYIAQILKQNPDLDKSFFDLKKGGALEMGIGSAHERKFLVRVEGKTTAPDDDVILEKKQMKHGLLGRCVRGDAADPTRVIAAQRKFTRSPQRLLGYVDVDGDSFYVHAWRVHYTELRVEDLRGPEELAELAYDIGLQLGRGHPLFPFASQEGKKERELIKKALDEVAPKLADDARELAERTTRGYERFREASAPRPGVARAAAAAAP